LGITGRYNFPAIQKATGLIIDALIAGTGWGAWLLASPFKPVINALRDLLINFLVNRGIILINIGLNIVDGVVDQKALDDALDAGIKRVMQGRDKITPAEGKKIDDDVRAAFDRDADLGASGVSQLPGPPI
jgi:hypothetical protein